MSVIYIIFTLALLIAIASVIAYIWAVRSGQFDDLDTPGARMLHDDEAADPPGKDRRPKASSED